MAPLIIGTASYAGRRYGPSISGWIVGMPLTSGPVIFFLALSHSASFAANAALGVLSGGLSLVAYALTYSWLATRFRWPVAISGSLFVFLQIPLFYKAPPCHSCRSLRWFVWRLWLAYFSCPGIRS
ncbi:MAG: hypothetical protein ACYC6R_14960 [Anaerolineales bacterium]